MSQRKRLLFILFIVNISQNYVYGMDEPPEPFRKGGPPKNAPVLGHKVTIYNEYSPGTKIDREGRPYIGTSLGNLEKISVASGGLNTLFPNKDDNPDKILTNEGTLFGLSSRTSLSKKITKSANFLDDIFGIDITLTCKNGENGYLGVQKVKKDSYQWAIFGAKSYLDNNTGTYSYKFRLHQNDDKTCSIQCEFGEEKSYLGVQKVKKDNYQYAFFATKPYLDNRKETCSYKFILHLNEDETYSIHCEFGEEKSYLGVCEIKKDSYQDAFFGTKPYLDKEKGYNKLNIKYFDDNAFQIRNLLFVLEEKEAECKDLMLQKELQEKSTAHWCAIAAAQGDSSAQYYLGVLHESGCGVEKDEKKAVRLYLIAAEQGDPSAQYYLGVLHESGRGVEKDDKEAVRWYQKAAVKGYSEAQCNLGFMYANGRGVGKNDKEAVRWYQKAAEQEHAEAQFKLGESYENGRGIEKDEKRAVVLYLKSAKQEHAGAQYNLGIMYANGRGVEKDDKEAVRWYQKAAVKGHADAQSNLGFMLDKGRGAQKDHKKAVEWYQKAAEQGQATAQYNLGVSYANGQGVLKDQQKAVEWYQKAAEKGHETAQYILGVRYTNGQGVEKNEKKAVEWYQKAAEKGHVEAQFKLGESYANGKGVLKDQKKAVEWYQKAAEKGHANAKTALGKLKK